MLEAIRPKILAVKMLANAHPAIVKQYGGDVEKHSSLGLITVDQDDSTYVALDEATKHSHVDVIFARSFYAGASHSSGRLSGEILGVLGGSDPDIVEEGLKAAIYCLKEDACFYAVDDKASIAFFPHVISSLGSYLSRESGLNEGDAMAYLVAPPLEATIAFDSALKSANIQEVKIFTPPTETNYAAMWASGELNDCEAAAEAFAESVLETSQNSRFL